MRSMVLGKILTDCKHDNCNLEIFSISNKPQLFLSFITALCESPPGQKSAYLPKPFEGKALINSGATSCFIHPSLVETFCLLKFPHSTLKTVCVIDGRTMNHQITHYTKFGMNI